MAEGSKHGSSKHATAFDLDAGGTGFLGPQTVEAALRRGHKVTLFNRGKTRPGLFPSSKSSMATATRTT